MMRGLIGCSRGPNREVLFGCGQSGIGSGVTNDAVGVEVHLPVMRVTAVRTNREHGAGEGEGQDLDVGSGVGQYVGNLRQVRLQECDYLMHVGGVVQLGLQVNTAIRIGGEVLDNLGEDFAIADDVADVVECVDGGDEEADLFDGPHHAACDNEVTHLERLQDDEEDPGSEVGQQSAPGQADGHAGGGNQGREAGGLDAEETQDRDDENDVQQRADSVLDVADDRGVNVLLVHAAADESEHEADQPTADNPQCKG